MNALAALERPDERLVLEERAVGDRIVDPLEILLQPPAGTDRQMADLGVPHLPLGQTDSLARGDEAPVRIGRPQVVEDGRARERDGVSRSRRRAAPAVEDDERYERAARQISAKDSISSEAPPTRAPSTSGCASSSAAFSGFTEPP